MATRKRTRRSRSSTEGARRIAPLCALDARLVGYAAGIAQYTLQLARHLGPLVGPERYVLLTGRRWTGERVDMPRTRLLTPPHHRLERWALPAEILARARPDLLHSLDHVVPAWGPWRSVVTVHDLAFHLLPQTQTPASRAYYAAAAESARRADRVIAVSRNTARDVERCFGVDPARIAVVHEAAGPEYVPRPREDLVRLAVRLGLDLDRPYLLFVGTLEPRKNLPLLLEAFALLRREADARLVVAGAPGWLEAPVFEAHARLGLGEAVRFVGSRARDELATLYSHAAVFAFPSLYEGFGLPLLEAMACGTPVVSSNAGPMPEVVGDAGLLLPPDDPAEWARALLRVLQDRNLADDLRRRGAARAASFSWERAAAETRAVYRDALGA